ncbi:MAG: aldehyde dehydrogenase family protein [Spirochaetes bacterium]|nr:aldehyde dehydrogenase family protein [Spirochaetota bacterium]
MSAAEKNGQSASGSGAAYTGAATAGAADVAALVGGLLERARSAQKIAASWDQERVDEVCVAIGWAVYKDDNIRILARSVVDETGMGVFEDKMTKHKNKVMGVLRDIRGAKSVGLVEVDEAKGIRKYAKPVGVVAALAPITNPTATPASNGLSILKGRNAVIFAPHPKAKRSTALAVEFMRQALAKVGAPEDLVQCVPEPSIEITQELMRRADLIVATGGGPMVKAAYSSGKPAFGVGPGNAVQLLAEDADAADAAKKIATSKCFDNATSCSSENSAFIHKSIYAAFLAALRAEGGFVLDAAAKEKLRKALWKDGAPGYDSRAGHPPALEAAMLARNAPVVARIAGIEVPAATRFLVVEGGPDPETDPFYREKITTVLTVAPVDSFEAGLDLVERTTDACGTGHSSGIFTYKSEYIERMGLRMRSSRIMVRQPMVSGNGGAFFNGMPSTVTLGCGTWGGNITTENIHWKQFINLTWLALPLPPNRPTDEEIFGKLWAKYGA